MRSTSRGSSARPPLVASLELTIGLTLLVPLIALPDHFIYPFVVPKVLAFRSLTAVALGLWLLLWIAWPERYRPRVTATSCGLAVFLVSYLASTLLGVDPYRSLWDTHERMLGLFTLVHFAAFYLVASTVLRTWVAWRGLFRVFLGMCLIVFAISFLQRWVNPELLGNALQDRVGSTLGHPAYLAGLAVTAVIIAVLLAFREKRRGWKAAALVVGALGVLALSISETRGGLLALSGGLVALALAYAIVVPDDLTLSLRLRPRRLLVSLALGGLLLGSAPFFLSGVEGLPGLRRFRDLSLSSAGVGTRIAAWQIALEAFQERPVVGWGPNCFSAAFDLHYRPELLQYGFEETWFDDAHSVPLNTLTEQGVPGLLAYLALLGTPLCLLWWRWRRGRADRHVVCAATAFVTAHLIQSAFVFESPSSWLYLVLLLAFFDAELGEAPAPIDGQARIHRGVALAVLGLVALLLWGELRAAQSNMAGLSAVRLIESGRSDEALASFERSVGIASPHRDGVRDVMAGAVLKQLESRAALRRQSTGPAETDAELRELAIRVYDALALNAGLHPRDVRIPLRRARIARQLQVLYSAPELGGIDRVAETRREIEAARRHSPRRQELHYELAVLELDGGFEPRRQRAALAADQRRGDTGAAAARAAEIRADLRRRALRAIGWLEPTIAWAPEVGESWWRLALAQWLAGDQASARETLLLARARGVPMSETGRRVSEQVLAGAASPDGSGPLPSR